MVLHGSANPIGGDLLLSSAGVRPENLLYKSADPFIKFALGENVKQSNWPSYNRFPQTRMGVEQVFVDYFQRAKEYQKVGQNTPTKKNKSVSSFLDISR